jgi:hypothetical protein
MAALTRSEAIERFQLALLQVLPQHLPAADYAVKGGANLRLFLDSVRRSEDIDFNFVGRTDWRLQPRMDAVLGSRALAAILAVHGMKIVSVNPSKTTTTTGRWKFRLAAPGVQFSSKVEFSMRQEDRPLYQMASVSSRLAAAAGMRVSVANHYLPTAALEQKVAALALRNESQVRDVFDLDFLLTRYPNETATAQLNADQIDLARRRVLEVTYGEYRELVVTFLDPAFVSMYQGEGEWERMALSVSTSLDTMRARIT